MNIAIHKTHPRPEIATVQLRTTVRIVALAVLSTCCAVGLRAGPDQGLLQDAVERFVQTPELERAWVGVLVADLETGTVLAEHNPNRPLIPASCLKLLTSAAVLSRLGPDHRFGTTICLSGSLDPQNGELNGELVLRGGGDPTLGSAFFVEPAMQKAFLPMWAQAVRDAGVRSVRGGVVGDATLFAGPMHPQTWAWEDVGNYYGAGAGALSISDNSYSLTLRSGAQPGSQTEVLDIEPPIPGLIFDNYVTASEVDADLATIFGAPQSHRRVLRGTIPHSRERFAIRGSIPDPALLAAHQFTLALRAADIHVSAAPRSLYANRPGEQVMAAERALHPVVQHLSPPLAQIVPIMLHRSVNVYAENLLRHLGLTAGGDGGNDSATRAATDFWQAQGMDIAGLSIHDGSGLSRKNLLTPQQLVFALQFGHGKNGYEPLLGNSLPVAGSAGTLRNFCLGTPAEGRIRAKSGSMSRIQCYAGYATTTMDQQLVFAVMINAFAGPRTTVRQHCERLLNSIIEHGHQEGKPGEKPEGLGVRLLVVPEE